MFKKLVPILSKSFKIVLLPKINDFVELCWVNHRAWYDINPKTLNLKYRLDLETLIYYALLGCMEITKGIIDCDYYDKHEIAAARNLCEAFNYVFERHELPPEYYTPIRFLNEQLVELMKVADKKITKDNVIRSKETMIVKPLKRRSGRR